MTEQLKILLLCIKVAEKYEISLPPCTYPKNPLHFSFNCGIFCASPLKIL